MVVFGEEEVERESEKRGRCQRRRNSASAAAFCPLYRLGFNAYGKSSRCPPASVRKTLKARPRKRRMRARRRRPQRPERKKKQVSKMRSSPCSLNSSSSRSAPRCRHDRQRPRERAHAHRYNAPVRRQALAHLPRAAVRPAVQPAVGVDGDDVPGVGRDVLLAGDVPQGREEALDPHGGEGRGGRRRRARAQGWFLRCSDFLAPQDIGN